MAGNTILTIDMVTRTAVSLFKNTNMFLKNIDTQYDNQFARDGAKIGDSLRVRLPNDFTVRTGPGLSIQDTTETFISLPLKTQKGVDIAFTSSERALKIEDYTERYIVPAMNDLAADIARDVMSVTEGTVPNYVSNVDGSNNVISPTNETFLNAGAVLDDNASPRSRGRRIVLDPWSQARTVSNQSGLFNPSQTISRQYQTGEMRNALGFDWYMDQAVIKHTTGTFSAGTVSGANQTGSTLVTNAITGTLNKGDIINLENVNAVNPLNKQTTGQLRQFVVTDNVASGATSIPIFPAIVPAAADGSAVQYQTVTVSPADGATISLASKAGETYRRNIAYAPQAFTMATADLFLPAAGVIEASRKAYDGISLRIISAYLPGTDQAVTRSDIIYGYAAPRGQWGVVVADKV